MSYQVSVLFWRDPNVPITPTTKVSQFLYLDMIMLRVIFDRQSGRIEHPDITSQPEQNPGGF